MDKNGFRRMKKERQIYKKLIQNFYFLSQDL